MLKNIAFVYFLLDFILIIVCAYFGAIYVLNSQIALICSSIITFASFTSYKNKINKKAKIFDKTKINEIFDDTNDTNENKNNEKMPKIPLNLYEFAAIFAPFRLLAYMLLIIAFFILLKNDLFRVFSFLAGLGIMPISALIFGVLNK